MRKTAAFCLSIAALCLAACGGSGSDDTFADPDNDAPVARLSVEARAEVGRPVLLDATASEDADGFIAEYLFDPGDGTALLQATSPELFHTFEEAGVFTVTLTVVDDDGTKDTNRVEVLVNAR